jgi:hypothetical protein
MNSYFDVGAFFKFVGTMMRTAGLKSFVIDHSELFFTYRTSLRGSAVLVGALCRTILCIWSARVDLEYFSASDAMHFSPFTVSFCTAFRRAVFGVVVYEIRKVLAAVCAFFGFYCLLSKMSISTLSTAKFLIVAWVNVKNLSASWAQTFFFVCWSPPMWFIGRMSTRGWYRILAMTFVRTVLGFWSIISEVLIAVRAPARVERYLAVRMVTLHRAVHAICFCRDNRKVFAAFLALFWDFHNKKPLTGYSWLAC